MSTFTTDDLLALRLILQSAEIRPPSGVSTEHIHDLLTKVMQSF